MNLNFFVPKSTDAEKIAPFFYMRPNKTCDSGVLDTFLWRDYYDVHVSIADDKALLFLMQSKGEYFSAMPYCKEEDLPHYFEVMEKYFNNVLKKPLKIYLADEEAVEALALKENSRYLVREEFDLKDYLYSGDELRNLSGKKFHKKKNLVNKFFREYEGRWEYRNLSCSDRETVLEFLDKWYEKRTEDEKETEDTLEYEVMGLHEMLKDCFSLKEFRAGGIFIDGQLEAFSIGALNPSENMACIAIEKGNSEFPGIYQVINQQLLIHEFPEADIINREDDCGLPGLRKAKESYNPIGYAKKYMVLQKDFEGWKEETTDRYEAEIGQMSDSMDAPYVLTDIKQKYETKALYEEVFPEDKGRFSDWYYEDRCRDNIIVSMRSDSDVIAMAHLNPFTVCNRNGQTAEIYYIYAVATKKEERNKGYMTSVLNKCFEILKDKAVPFCFLIPVEESIYTPFGFHNVSKFTPERIPDFDDVVSNYNIYLREDEEYLRRALIEDELCENMEEALPKDPVIMVKIISEDAFAKFSGLSNDSTEDDMINWLRKQRIYISESV